MNAMLGMLLHQGLAAYQAGDLVKAESLLRGVLQMDAHSFDALHLLGLLLGDCGRHAESICLIEQALAVAPGEAAAWSNLGSTLNAEQRRDDAQHAYETALRLAPDMPEALNGLGNVLLAQGDARAALTRFDAAISCQPDFAEAHNNRGNALFALRHLPEAIEAYDVAIQLRPRYAEAFNNKGFALVQLRRCAEALAAYEQALAIAPDYTRALLNKGLCYLLQGNYAAGWPLYEYRWSDQQRGQRQIFRQPPWQGDEALQGRTILVYAEQGFGDTLQFCRYVPLLRERGAHVVLELPAALLDLAASLGPGIDCVRSGAKRLHFDLHCPLASLPRAFATTLDTIPAAFPYLAADAARITPWQARLGLTGERSRIGLVLSGSQTDPWRALDPALLDWLPACDADLVVLQQTLGERERAWLARHPGVKAPAESLESFADTAAVIAQLDLVISVDTAVAHLAGAMDKPLWLMLYAGSDWRWQCEGAHSVWYRSARLFRQAQHGDWTTLLTDELEPALRHWLSVHEGNA
jgi:tetratricopeptide (TPR) repeat protein